MSKSICLFKPFSMKQNLRLAFVFDIYKLSTESCRIYAVFLLTRATVYLISINVVFTVSMALNA